MLCAVEGGGRAGLAAGGAHRALPRPQALPHRQDGARQVKLQLPGIMSFNVLLQIMYSITPISIKEVSVNLW